MGIKTKVVKSRNGHQVKFTIGVQTFRLEEQEPEEGMSSEDYAKWYEKQLKSAFNNLRPSRQEIRDAIASHSEGTWMNGNRRFADNLDIESLVKDIQDLFDGR